MTNKTHKNELYSKRITKYTWWILTAWTLILLGIFANDLSTLKEATHNLAVKEARAHLQKDEAFRFWATTHGGFYVPANERTPPNPYLAHILERDIETPSGEQLTLMNPAYAVRQMNEEYTETYGVAGHITSLLPLRPENAPDDWERLALESFEEGETEALEITEFEGKPSLRLMQPLTTQEGCLKCHAHQGYEVGDVRGGVSVSVPLADYLAEQHQATTTHTVSYLLLWSLGIITIFSGSGAVKKNGLERIYAQKMLQESHDQLETRVQERTSELNQLNQQINASLQEKETLLREVHHRVKNNFQVIIALANLQKDTLSDSSTILMLKEFQERIRAMSLVHEQLYQSDNLAGIDFGNYLNSLVLHLIQSFDTGRQINSRFDVDSSLMGIDKAIPCGLMVTELVTNTLKYAFPLDDRLAPAQEAFKPEISIEFHANEGEDEKVFTLVIRDNGNGLPPDLDWRNTESMGLKLVKLWATHQLGGKLEVETSPGEGTAFIISFTESNRMGL